MLRLAIGVDGRRRDAPWQPRLDPVTDDLDDTVIVRHRSTPVSPSPSLPDGDDTVIMQRDEIVDRHHEPVPRHPVTVRGNVAPRRVYSFRVGEVSHPLDVPCTIGRRPSAPRVPEGPAPRLVTVASPLKEVSASHVELRQRGLTVVVTDLRSTNGTVVLMPGSVPRKLRQGESIVVSPGTLVDIGDDNVLQILPMQHLA